VVESVPDRTPAAGRPPRAKGTYDRCPLFSPSHSDGKGLGEGKTLDEPLPASSYQLPAREDARRPEDDSCYPSQQSWEGVKGRATTRERTLPAALPPKKPPAHGRGLGGALNPVVASARRPTERSPPTRRRHRPIGSKCHPPRGSALHPRTGPTTRQPYAEKGKPLDKPHPSPVTRRRTPERALPVARHQPPVTRH
jgi:hypothetical protein